MKQIARERVQLVEIFGIPLGGQVKSSQIDRAFQRTLNQLIAYMRLQRFRKGLIRFFTYFEVFESARLVTARRFGQFGYDRVQAHRGNSEQPVHITVRHRFALIDMMPCENFRRQQAKVERDRHLRVKAHRFDELLQ